MFKISNTQKAILDILGIKQEVEIHCNSGSKFNSIDPLFAFELGLPISKPRKIPTEDGSYPISVVEFTLEITSLDGEIKRITDFADVAIHMRKDKDAIRIGTKLLKELEACIIM
jgi:hypothetical protein